MPVVFFAVFFMFAIASVADAGWLITSANGDETLISKGKLKSNWDNGSMIIDAAKNEIFFIDDDRKMIASGNADEICDEMKQSMESMMASMPEEQREMMKKMMGGGKEVKVEVVKKGSGGNVSGFETTRYEVMADGKLYEEIWISENKELLKDCAEVMKMMGKFASCMHSAIPMGSAPVPEASPEYAKIYEMGMMVKSVSHSEDKSSHDNDFTSITKKDLSDDIFALPDGYKKVSFQALWGMEQE